VADSNRVGATPNNHRVLLYQNVSGIAATPTSPLTYNRKCPYAWAGEPVLASPISPPPPRTSRPTALRLPANRAVASDGVRLWWPIPTNRVLIWNRIPSRTTRRQTWWWAN